MATFSGDNMEVEIKPALRPGEKQHILVTHDESCFSSYDGSRWIWKPIGEQPLRKKGQGRSIHVSDFLCDVSGRLCLTDEEQTQNPNLPAEACVMITPGKNNDGWWTGEDLVKQVVEKAIPIFEAKYPDFVAVFAFDNASSHAAYAENALVASRMNLKSKGKQPRMRFIHYNFTFKSNPI